jgi:hypothetical protein
VDPLRTDRDRDRLLGAVSDKMRAISWLADGLLLASEEALCSVELITYLSNYLRSLSFVCLVFWLVSVSD